jgi:hypothetical protein
MRIRVLSFGSNWWGHFGRDPSDPYRFTRHAAYYNSTGVRCGARVRRHWIVPGLVRFNGTGDFNPHHPQSAIGKTFFASELEFAFGGNRLLLGKIAPRRADPDCYLVVVTAALHGHIDISSSGKPSSGSVIAASRLREIEETMLLMRAGDWVQTSCGFWQLRPSFSAPKRMNLERIAGGAVAGER